MMKMLAGLVLASALCSSASDVAEFTKSNEFVHPMNYREWIFLSSGLGMTYGPNAPAAGSRLRFADVFNEELRDSLDRAIEPLFRMTRGVAPDSSLKAAGFWFEDERFHLNDNFAFTPGGMLWHFDPYEIAPYASVHCIATSDVHASPATSARVASSASPT